MEEDLCGMSGCWGLPGRVEQGPSPCRALEVRVGAQRKLFLTKGCKVFSVGECCELHFILFIKKNFFFLVGVPGWLSWLGV